MQNRTLRLDGARNQQQSCHHCRLKECLALYLHSALLIALWLASNTFYDRKAWVLRFFFLCVPLNKFSTSYLNI